MIRFDSLQTSMNACCQLITAAMSLNAQISLVALIAVVQMVIEEMAMAVKVLSFLCCLCVYYAMFHDGEKYILPLANIFSAFRKKRDLSLNV